MEAVQELLSLGVRGAEVASLMINVHGSTAGTEWLVEGSVVVLWKCSAESSLYLNKEFYKTKFRSFVGLHYVPFFSSPNKIISLT